jgi:hypothetical protein
MGEDRSELQDAVSEGAVGSQPTAVRRQKPPDFAGIREAHPNAYEPWSIEEDKRLLQLHTAGASIAELAKLHRRPVSAIRSRLRQLASSYAETSDG